MLTFVQRPIDLFGTARGRYANTEPIVTGLKVIDGLKQFQEVIAQVVGVDLGQSAVVGHRVEEREGHFRQTVLTPELESLELAVLEAQALVVLTKTGQTAVQ